MIFMLRRITEKGDAKVILFLAAVILFVIFVVIFLNIGK